MTDFGGMGGVWQTRPVDETDLFEVAVRDALGEAMKEDDSLCVEVWSSLANAGWRHPEAGHTASYTFRAAGDLVAAIRGRGMYMDWYCSGPYATCSERVAAALAPYGWVWDERCYGEE